MGEHWLLKLIVSYLIIGIGILALIWAVSTIQIRVWIKYIEKFLLSKHDEIKNKTDEKVKE